MIARAMFLINVSTHAVKATHLFTDGLERVMAVDARRGNQRERGALGGELSVHDDRESAL